MSVGHRSSLPPIRSTRTSKQRLARARYISVSPDRQRVAILAVSGAVPLTADRTLGRGNVRTRQLGVARIDRPGSVQWLESKTIRQIGQWAPDGTRLSVSTVSTDTLSASDGFAVVTVNSTVPAIEPLRFPGFIAARGVFPLWDTSGSLLMFGHEEAALPKGTRPRNDWWSEQRCAERPDDGNRGSAERIDSSAKRFRGIGGRRIVADRSVAWGAGSTDRRQRDHSPTSFGPGYRPPPRPVAGLFSMGEVNGEIHYYRGPTFRMAHHPSRMSPRRAVMQYQWHTMPTRA